MSLHRVVGNIKDRSFLTYRLLVDDFLPGLTEACPVSPPGRGIWPRDDEPQLWGLAAVTQILALPFTSWVTLGKLFNISVFSSTKQSLVVRSKRLDTCKTPVQHLAHSKYSINASYYFYHYHQHYHYFIVWTDLLTWLLEEGKHQIQSRNLN